MVNKKILPGPETELVAAIETARELGTALGESSKKLFRLREVVGDTRFFDLLGDNLLWLTVNIRFFPDVLNPDYYREQESKKKSIEHLDYLVKKKKLKELGVKTPPAPKCLKCLWLQKIGNGFTCEAYPRGIPDNILMGEMHIKILPGQEGEYVFTE